MMMNWDNIVKLLLPIFMRPAKRLRRLIGGLTAQTTSDCDAASIYKDMMVVESQRIGQKKVVEQVLKETYGVDITLTNGEMKEPRIVKVAPKEEITLIGVDDPNVVLFPSMDNTDLGYDVGVVMPEGFPADQVDGALAMVERYVFPGVIVFKV